MLIAHQGGWDELLIIAIPLMLYAGIRLWERSRGPEDPDDEGAEDSEPGPGRGAGSDP